MTLLCVGMHPSQIRICSWELSSPPLGAVSARPIDSSFQRLCFHLCLREIVETAGWFGFGLSDHSGGMIGSDAVIGGKTKSGNEFSGVYHLAGKTSNQVTQSASVGFKDINMEVTGQKAFLVFTIAAGYSNLMGGEDFTSLVAAMGSPPDSESKLNDETLIAA